MFVFGKKMQICGFVAGPRIDEVQDNVFHVGSRINSTWGGNLVDMVRSKHYLRVIHEEKLLDNVKAVGEVLLSGLQQLHKEFPTTVSNPRAKGLMGALTIVDGATRSALLKKLNELGVLMLPCGFNSIRVRPSLNITKAEMEEGMQKLGEALKAVV
jgi:L-lysine 6-transaminase